MVCVRLKRSLSLSLLMRSHHENASSSSSHFRVIVLVRAFRSRDRFRPSRLHHPSGVMVVVVVVVHRLRLRSVDDHHLLWQHVLRVHRTQLPSVARTQTHEKRERTDQQRRPETRETRNRAEILFLDEEEPRVPRVGGHDGVARGVDDARHVFAPRRRRLFTVVENIFSNWTRNALHFLCRL